MLQDSPAAAKFIDTIIDAKLNGVEMDTDVRATLHENLLHKLEGQITATIVSQLNEHQQTELEHLIDTDQEEQIESYLIKQDIDLNRILAHVMADFQAAYLGA